MSTSSVTSLSSTTWRHY